MIINILKKRCYFVVNVIAFVLIMLGSLHASDDILDLNPSVKFQAFSSEVSLKGIGDNILGIVSTAEKMVTIASDKCTNEEFLDDLISLCEKRQGLVVNFVSGEDKKLLKFFKKNISTHSCSISLFLRERLEKGCTISLL